MTLFHDEMIYFDEMNLDDMLHDTLCMAYDQ